MSILNPLWPQGPYGRTPADDALILPSPAKLTLYDALPFSLLWLPSLLLLLLRYTLQQRSMQQQQQQQQTLCLPVRPYFLDTPMEHGHKVVKERCRGCILGTVTTYPKRIISIMLCK